MSMAQVTINLYDILTVPETISQVLSFHCNKLTTKKYNATFRMSLPNAGRI